MTVGKYAANDWYHGDIGKWCDDYSRRGSAVAPSLAVHGDSTSKRCGSVSAMRPNALRASLRTALRTAILAAAQVYWLVALAYQAVVALRRPRIILVSHEARESGFALFSTVSLDVARRWHYRRKKQTCGNERGNPCGGCYWSWNHSQLAAKDLAQGHDAQRMR